MPRQRKYSRCKLKGCSENIKKDRRGKQFCCDEHSNISKKMSVAKSRDKRGYMFSKHSFVDFDRSETDEHVQALIDSVKAKPVFYRYRCRTCGCRVENESAMVRDVAEFGDMVYYCDHNCHRLRITDEMMTREANNTSGNPFRISRNTQEINHEAVHKEPKFSTKGTFFVGYSN